MVRFINILAVAFAVVAAVVPVEDASIEVRQANDCRIDHIMGPTWVESGMTRHKVEFSTTNSAASKYCDIWRAYRSGSVNNFQCWTWEDDTKGELDVSYARGPVGDGMFVTDFRDTIDDWRVATHCQTD